MFEITTDKFEASEQGPTRLVRTSTRYTHAIPRYPDRSTRLGQKTDEVFTSGPWRQKVTYYRDGTPATIFVITIAPT